MNDPEEKNLTLYDVQDNTTEVGTVRSVPGDRPSGFFHVDDISVYDDDDVSVGRFSDFPANSVE